MFLMEKEIKEQPEVLKTCILKNAGTVAALADEFKKRDCRFAVVAARGTSDHAAVYFKYLAEVYASFPVSLAAPSVITSYGARPQYGNSLVIGVSQSGMAADVLEVLKLAKSQGALVASVTNDPESPLAKIADYHLDCFAGEEKSVAATKTFSAQLMVLAQLVAQISGNASLKQNLDTAPALMGAVIDRAEEIDSLVARYRFAGECFTLGRGFLYPIAMEAALKVQETCYLRAKSYSVADFQHGPFAMTTGEIPVFCYAADSHTDEDLNEMIEKSKNAGAEVAVITNKAALAAIGDVSFLLPEGAEGPAGAFAAAAFAQLFACKLSGIRGNNPDKPRGLKKVTITI